MERRTANIIIFFLLVGALIFSIDKQRVFAEQRTIIVPDDCPTIQGAIYSADLGDTIFVKNGTYPEHIIIDKTLRLIGQDVATTIIDGGGTDVITVKANNVEIINFTIQSFPEQGWASLEGPFNGIYVGSADNCTIIGNKIRYSEVGIYLQYSSNNTIIGNLVESNWYGIYVEHSSYNILSDNNLTDNYGNFGVIGYESSHFVQHVDLTNTIDGKPIYYWVNRQSETVPSDAGYVGLVNCKRILVEELELEDKQASLWGRDAQSQGILLANTIDSTITRNNIKKKTCGIHLWNSSDNGIYENNITNSQHGLCLSYSSNDIIYENNVMSNNYGIVLTNSQDNVIFRNTVENNDYEGVSLGDSSNNEFYENDVNSNSEGFSLHGSFNNILHENNITSNGKGVYLSNSFNNNIYRNLLTHNNYGVFLRDACHHNNVSENNLTDNEDAGISLVFSNDGNVVCRNNINNSVWGIDFMEAKNNTVVENNLTKNFAGINMASSDCNELYGNNLDSNSVGVGLFVSSDNRFHHNNFANNTKNIDDVSWENPYAPRSVNIWDDGYPAGGNYWSDYNGTDLYSGVYQNETGSDGIGDKEYIIDGSNTDNYPLMGAFSDFKATSEYNVQTICNSTISDFQFNGTAIRFNVSGENGTTGFCRICIPTALMNGIYRVFVNSTEVTCNLLTCSNNTYSYLYFNYTHSTQEVIIIPEFPPFLIPPLMIATLLTVIVHRRKCIGIE